MSFRTVEITGPAEIHVKSGALLIEKEKKAVFSEDKETKEEPIEGKKKRKKKTGKEETEIVRISIPLEDISTIICMGAGIRISTMAMAKICDNKISMMMLDEKYQPAGILSAYEANARQSLTMRRQVFLEKERENRLWMQIVKQKIENQAQALDCLQLPGVQKVRTFFKVIEEKEGTNAVTETDFSFFIDPLEAGAAKTYFEFLSPEMNRREETPFNSRLNYGYSIIRNSLIRAVIAAGLIPAFGIHHQNLYNAFNLADDLIEPFRPCVDLVAYSMEETQAKLSREERRQLAGVLSMAVLMDDKKMAVLQAIESIVNDYRKYILDETDAICLPVLIPYEAMNLIKE